MITDNPYLFALAFALFWTTLGAGLGWKLSKWRVGCLERRNELLKMELDRLAPGRGRYLR